MDEDKPKLLEVRLRGPIIAPSSDHTHGLSVPFRPTFVLLRIKSAFRAMVDAILLRFFHKIGSSGHWNQLACLS